MTMIDAIGGSKVIGNHRDHDDDLDLRKKMRMMMMRITIYLREWRVCLFVCTLGSRLEMNWSLGRRMVRDESR